MEKIFDSSFGNLFSRSLLSFYLVIVFLNTHDKAMFTKKIKARNAMEITDGG